jgi:hypothetical protein
MTAHGALITGLSSQDTLGFLPQYSDPQLDVANGRESPAPGDAAFPAGLDGITSTGRGANFSQTLSLVPAEFRPTPGLAVPGRGAERLFTHIQAQVLYSADTSDQLAPTILSGSATVTGNSVSVIAQVQDLGNADPINNVKRVLALVTQAGAGAQWIPIDLHPSASPSDPAGTWVGTYNSLPVSNSAVDLLLQAADGSGNVGSFASKGAYFNAENVSSGPLRFDRTGTLGDNGWYQTAVTVRIVPPQTLTLRTRPITYNIDGGANVTVTPTFNAIAGNYGVTIPQFPGTAESVHTILAFQAGQQTSRTQILIDPHAPNALIASGSGGSGSAAGWFADDPHTVNLVPQDPTTNGQGSGVSSITYSATGAYTIAQTTVPEPAPPAVAQTTIGAEGVTTLSVTAKDRAGNTSASGVFPIGVDSVMPTVTATATNPPQVHGWHLHIPTVTLTANDAAPSSGLRQLFYTVNGASPATPTTGAATPVVQGATPGASMLSVNIDTNMFVEGHNNVQFWTADDAGNTTQAQTVMVNVDSTPPVTHQTTSPTPNVAGWEKANTTLTFSSSDPASPGDGTPASGVSSITWGATADATKGGFTQALTPFAGSSTPYTLSTEGITTFTYYATDVAGNVEGPNQVTVRLDKTAPTVTCGTPDTAWHGVNVSFGCTAFDTMSGLLNGADATFAIGTSLPAGQESATVATDARAAVPDVAGNSTNVPVRSPIKIDLKPPQVALSLTATNANAPVGPSATDTQTFTQNQLVGGHIVTTKVGSGAAIPNYLLGQAASATFSCPDGGSGTVTCTGQNDGTGASTTTLNTSAVGMHTFLVTGIDAVGNKFTTTYQYRVVYNLCLNYNPSTAKNIGSTISIQLKLCNSAGTVVSVPNVTLTAVAADNGGATLSANQAGNKNQNFFVNSPGWYEYDLKTDSTYKTSSMNWLNFRITTDPATGTPPNPLTQAYLNLTYRANFTLK